MSGDVACAQAQRRLFKAVLAVCAVVFSVPCVDAVVRFTQGGQEPVAVGAIDRGIDSAALLDSADAFGSLERIEAVAQEVGVAIPGPFSTEVGLLPGARDIRVSSRGDVVGYLVDKGSAETLDEVNRHMRAGGWTEVPLGGVQGATFVKSKGECTWALITCTQVDASTAVIVRTVVS